MFGIGKSAEERQREKERKKRGARKYGQANFKHSRMGIVSCINSIGGLLILAGCIFYAFMARGPLTESVLQSGGSVSVNGII